jgi:hypothetical protein
LFIIYPEALTVSRHASAPTPPCTGRPNSSSAGGPGTEEAQRGSLAGGSGPTPVLSWIDYEQFPYRRRRRSHYFAEKCKSCTFRAKSRFRCDFWIAPQPFFFYRRHTPHGGIVAPRQCFPFQYFELIVYGTESVIFYTFTLLEKTSIFTFSAPSLTVFFTEFSLKNHSG